MLNFIFWCKYSRLGIFMRRKGFFKCNFIFNTFLVIGSFLLVFFILLTLIHLNKIPTIVFGILVYVITCGLIERLYNFITVEIILEDLKNSRDKARSELFKNRELQVNFSKDDYFSKLEIELIQKELRILKEFYFLESKINKK